MTGGERERQQRAALTHALFILYLIFFSHSARGPRVALSLTYERTGIFNSEQGSKQSVRASNWARLSLLV